MIRLDSIKVKLPIDSIADIKNFNAMNMIHTTQKIQGVEHSSLTQKGYAGFGIGATKVSEDSVLLNLSAKVLLDNYLEGINQNTIAQAFENYNKVSNVMLNIDKALEGQFLTCDSFQMIRPNYSISDCINSLTLLRTNNNFDVQLYEQQHNEGAVLTHQIKTEKRRLILYNKHKELMLKGKSKFLANCKAPAKILSSTKGLLRVEQNNASIRSIRNRFLITTPTKELPHLDIEFGAITKKPKIMEVLQSSQNPNYNFMQKYTSSIKQLDIFNSRYKSIDSCLKDLGRIGLLKECNYDFTIVRTYLMQNIGVSKRQINRQLKQMKETYKNLQMKKNLEDKNPYNITNHLLELIKEAV